MQSIQACVPMPLQIVIDDMGWWCGQDGHERGEPFRTGISRDHVVADYAAIARLGRSLGMRPQAAMILAEWDRYNRLREVPSATWQGADWDNSRWVGPWLDEAAALMREQAQHIELTLHGLGHEYWQQGAASRAEWYDRQGRMRPRDQVLAHLNAYAAILADNGLGEFPTSFVPAAFNYRFGDELAPILADWGIRFISTPFASMHRRRQTEHELFGLEAGIVTVDRGRVPRIPWCALDATPEALQGPILGLHWPNILHADPARNTEVVDRWVALLQAHGAQWGQMLAPNTDVCRDQLLFHAGTYLRVEDGRIICDFTSMDGWPDVGARRFALDVRGREVGTLADGPCVVEREVRPEGEQRLWIELDGPARGEWVLSGRDQGGI